jgi:hypothetical protein
MTQVVDCLSSKHNEFNPQVYQKTQKKNKKLRLKSSAEIEQAA